MTATTTTTTTAVSSHWFQILIILAALTTPHHRHQHQGRLWLAALGKTTTQHHDEPTEQALFGMGSFWSSPVFSRQPGVLRVTAGYAATTRKPSPASYLSVCAGDGRTEAILVEFLPSQTSYEQLLQVFWNHSTPSSTELQHQHQQSRAQYQSILWPLTDHQRVVAEQSLQQLQNEFDRISTTIATTASTTHADDTAAPEFIVAESMHQNFWFKLRLKLACLVAGVTSIRWDRGRLNNMTHMALETVLVWILWEGLEICVKGLGSVVGGGGCMIFESRRVVL